MFPQSGNKRCLELDFLWFHKKGPKKPALRGAPANPSQWPPGPSSKPGRLVEHVPLNASHAIVYATTPEPLAISVWLQYKDIPRPYLGTAQALYGSPRGPARSRPAKKEASEFSVP